MKKTITQMEEENNEMKKTLLDQEELLKVTMAEAVEKRQKDVETIAQLEKENSDLMMEVEVMGKQLVECNREFDERINEREQEREGHSILQSEHDKLKSLIHEEELLMFGPVLLLVLVCFQASTTSGQRKGRELADMMERRKVDILCVQETRWKGSKARSIGAGFKLFYYGVDSKRNGVGVVLKEEFVRNVLEVGCELEEKERFWSELDEMMESIPTGERVVIGADFNGHVGEGNRGDEEVIGKFRVKERNLEGQMKLRQALGGQVVLPDGRKVLGVPSGRRKEDKDTWWWNEEVQDGIQRKRLAKKKWDMDRTEKNRQEYKELQRRVKSFTLDLEKAYDKVLREELWYCMRKSGVAEKYVRVVQDMYERSRTVVRCAVVMDQLSEEVRQESPWTMMFADDIVICSESREQVEENLERWRFALERREMKVQRVLSLTVANVIPLGLLHMRPFQLCLRDAGFYPLRHPLSAIRDTCRALHTLLMLKRPRFLSLGPTQGAYHHHKTLLMDASILGWGVVLDSCPAQGLT
ncbi:hypothetical protein QTP86_012411 [Hemibagrus guttatus]|nr:hypothetical protein QTP86_012411 [Hemibagrus guttatus]